MDSTVDGCIKTDKKTGQKIDSKMSQAAGCSLLPPSCNYYGKWAKFYRICKLQSVLLTIYTETVHSNSILKLVNSVISTSMLIQGADKDIYKYFASISFLVYLISLVHHCQLPVLVLYLVTPFPIGVVASLGWTKECLTTPMLLPWCPVWVQMGHFASINTITIHKSSSSWEEKKSIHMNFVYCFTLNVFSWLPAFPS